MLSPTLFLIVMDELLHSLRSNKSGISISNLYLGGAAHADDVTAVSTSVAVANCQSLLISDFASHHGLKLNNPKTEVVKFSQNKASHDTTISLLGSSICVAHEAKCLGYTWNSTLNARSSVRENIHKARKSFFSLGSTGCFLGHSSPLTAKTIVETCVFPILLYGAENWILNDECLRLLENFQAELGRRILKLSRYHSNLSVSLGLSWPSITSRILITKLKFLCRLLSSETETVATRTLHTLASEGLYSLGIVQQCIFLDSKLKVNTIPNILNNIDDPRSELKDLEEMILKSGKTLTYEESLNHQSVKLACNINWLRVWESARDKGPYWTRTAQSFYRILTSPLFGDRICRVCSTEVPRELSYIEHLVSSHCDGSTLSLDYLLSNLESLSDVDLINQAFHAMKVIVSAHVSNY